MIALHNFFSSFYNVFIGVGPGLLGPMPSKSEIIILLRTVCPLASSAWRFNTNPKLFSSPLYWKFLTFSLFRLAFDLYCPLTLLFVSVTLVVVAVHFLAQTRVFRKYQSIFQMSSWDGVLLTFNICLLSTV